MTLIKSRWIIYYQWWYNLKIKDPKEFWFATKRNQLDRLILENYGTRSFKLRYCFIWIKISSIKWDEQSTILSVGLENGTIECFRIETEKKFDVNEVIILKLKIQTTPGTDV